jgi:iron-sulfur cluster assembly accessory protein
MIYITKEAAIQMKELTKAKGLGDKAGLRLWVEKGGCAGMSYEMAVQLPVDGDLIYEQDGAFLLTPPDSLSYLDESTIDYEDGLSGAGFRIHNPHATRNCGCGTSFEPLAEETAA